MRFKLLTLPLLTLMVSVACTEKGKPFVNHEPSRLQSTDSNELTAPDPSAVENPSTQGLQALDLKQLADRVLSKDRLSDSNSYVARDVQDELIVFNRRLLETKDKSSPEFIALLKRVQVAMLTDCQGFIDSCQGVRYFSRAPSSSDVAKLIAQNDPDNYFKFIMISVRIRNKIWDPEIPALLLNKPKDHLSASELKYAETIRSILETTIEQARLKMTNPKEARAFLESIHAWTLLTDPSWNLTGPAGEALFAMMAQAGMLYGNNGQLHPELVSAVTQLNADASQNPNGIMIKQKSLVGQKNLSTVGVAPFTEINDIMFIMDAVFTRRMTPASGAALFATSSRTVAELEKLSEQYLRLQFLASLQESTAMAQKIYSARVQSDELFNYARHESASIARVWNTFKSLAAPFRDFTLLAIRAQPAPKDNVDHEKSMRSLFDSIDKSIVISSVYPQELILFHRLAQTHVDVDVPMSDGTPRRVDTSTLMKYLFEAQILPIMQYGDSQIVLNQYELMYAFDFAVRSGLMEASSVDIDFFMSSTLHRLEEGPMNRITNTLEHIDHRFSKTPNYNFLKEACNEFRPGGHAPARRFYLGEVAQSPYYGSLIGNAFATMAPTNNDSTSAGGSDNGGIWYADVDYTEALEMARLDLGNGIRLGEAMLSIYTAILTKAGASTADIQAKTKNTAAEIASYRAKRNDIIDASDRWYTDIGFCYWKALNRDFQVREELITAEVAYLREVYRKMARLRDPAISAEESAAIVASIQFQGLPSGFKGQDRISKDGYLYSSADLLLRVRNYMKVGLPSSQILPVAPDVTIDPGSNLNNDSDLIRKSIQSFIAFSPTEDEFVASGIRHIFSQSAPSLAWMAYVNNAIGKWGLSLSSAVSLHRLEYEVRGTSKATSTDEILKTHEQILSWTNFTAMDRWLNKTLARKDKVTTSVFADRTLTFDQRTNKPASFWGMYDFPLKLAQLEELGYAWASTDSTSIFNDGKREQNPDAALRQTYLAAGRTYYTSRANSYRGRSVLPYNPKLDATLDDSIGRFVRTELNDVETFTQQLKNHVQVVNRLGPADRPHFDLDSFTTISGPLVDMDVVNTFADKVDQFHQMTSQCFKNSVAQCKEFAP